MVVGNLGEVDPQRQGHPSRWLLPDLQWGTAVAQRAHLTPHPRRQLLQPRPFAHPQTAGPSPQNPQAARFGGSGRANADPPQHSPQRLLDQAHHRPGQRSQVARQTRRRKGKAIQKGCESSG